MISCKRCETTNAPDEVFCVSCGAFLEEYGEPVEAAPSSNTSDDPAGSTSEASTDNPDRAGADAEAPPTGSEQDDKPATKAKKPASAAPAEPASSAAEGAGTSADDLAQGASSSGREATDWRAHPLISRNASGTAAPSGVRGKPCPRCQAGNYRDADFCDRCAYSFLEKPKPTPTAHRPSFLDRLLGRIDRHDAYKLGHKPDRPLVWPRRLGIITGTIVVVLVIVVVVGQIADRPVTDVVIDPIARAATQIRCRAEDRFQGSPEWQKVKIKATGNSDDWGNLNDRKEDTTWVTGSTEGTRQVLIGLDEPKDVQRLRIYLSDDDGMHLPQRVDVRFTTDPNLPMDDVRLPLLASDRLGRAGRNVVELCLRSVRELELTFEGVPEGSTAGINEIDVFARP